MAARQAPRSALRSPAQRRVAGSSASRRSRRRSRASRAKHVCEGDDFAKLRGTDLLQRTRKDQRRPTYRGMSLLLQTGERQSMDVLHSLLRKTQQPAAYLYDALVVTQLPEHLEQIEAELNQILDLEVPLKLIVKPLEPREEDYQLAGVSPEAGDLELLVGLLGGTGALSNPGDAAWLDLLVNLELDTDTEEFLKKPGFDGGCASLLLRAMRAGSSDALIVWPKGDKLHIYDPLERLWTSSDIEMHLSTVLRLVFGSDCLYWRDLTHQNKALKQLERQIRRTEPIKWDDTPGYVAIKDLLFDPIHQEHRRDEQGNYLLPPAADQQAGHRLGCAA
mmetsp:Transcript_24110/g.62109  ORF Transcript_24110/g.62109 Transcript_24110/m.62109 type:complete len:334 (+) Transcript_24110:839-1840(+)